MKGSVITTRAGLRVWGEGTQESRGGQREFRTVASLLPSPHLNLSQGSFCLQTVGVEGKEARGLVAAHPAQFEAGTTEEAGAC